MEIVSVLLIVISGSVLSTSFGRLVLGWGNDVVILATAMVTFGVGGLALVVLSKLGIYGIILSLVAAILLTFVFVKFNVKDVKTESKSLSVLGCIYWTALLIIFTSSGFKSWDISVEITTMYSLGENINFFYFTLSLFVIVGGLSMLMLIHEYKRT